MKKTKLLTSLVALALVFSLGACSEAEDNSVTGGESDSTVSSETSGDTSKEDVVTYEYSIEVANGSALTELVFNDDLEEQTSVTLEIYLVTTPSEGEATKELASTANTTLTGYDSSIVTVSDFTITPVSGGTTSITISSEGYTSTSISVVVDDQTDYAARATEEAIRGILSAVEKGFDWSAFHGEYTDESQDEYREVYLTTDEDGNLYGSVLVYDTDEEELSWEYHYTYGYEYSHGLSNDNYFINEDSEDFEYESYEDVLNEFTCGFEPFTNLFFEERDDWKLEIKGSTYTLTISGDGVTDSVICEKNGSTYTLIGIQEVNEGTGPFYNKEITYAESISKAEVELTLADFDTEPYAGKLTYDGDPVADIFETIEETSNYTLTIEYDDWTSADAYESKEEMYDAYYGGNMSTYGRKHYFVDLTYTEDVFLLEYSTSGNHDILYESELYVNNGSNLDYWWSVDTYSTEIECDSTIKNESWQTYWEDENMIALVNDYTSYFAKDENSYEGTKLDYSVNIESLDSLNVLLDTMYHCGNYYADSSSGNSYAPFVRNISTYWNSYGVPEQVSRYYTKTQEWVTELYYLVETGDDSSGYKLEYHGATAYVSNAGTSEIGRVYASQLA